MFMCLLSITKLSLAYFYGMSILFIEIFVTEINKSNIGTFHAVFVKEAMDLSIAKLTTPKRTNRFDVGREFRPTRFRRLCYYRRLLKKLLRAYN
jgi:hypothetical protein